MNKWIVITACAAALALAGCNSAEEPAPKDSNTPKQTKTETPAPSSTDQPGMQAAMVKCPMCGMEHKREDMKDVNGTLYCVDCGCAAKAEKAGATTGEKSGETKPDDKKATETKPEDKSKPTGSRGAPMSPGG